MHVAKIRILIVTHDAVKFFKQRQHSEQEACFDECMASCVFVCVCGLEHTPRMTSRIPQTQIICRRFARKFNTAMANVEMEADHIEFLESWCVQTEDGRFGCVEPYMDQNACGAYVKYNDNTGDVLDTVLENF